MLVGVSCRRRRGSRDRRHHHRLFVGNGSKIFAEIAQRRAPKLEGAGVVFFACIAVSSCGGDRLSSRSRGGTTRVLAN